jgi:integrase
MVHERQKFQAGSLRKVVRKDGFGWEFRYRDNSRPGRPQRQITLSSTKFPTEAKALAHLQITVMKINGDASYVGNKQPTMRVLIDRFIESERLRETKALPPGDAFVEGVQYSTSLSYLTYLRRIEDHWADVLIQDVKPAAVDEWLRSLKKISNQMVPLSPKTRASIKGLLHRLFERAMFWEMVPIARNPIALVEVRGASKRSKRPIILTSAQYLGLVEELASPYKEMVQVAMCLGLRVSEVLALQWNDFDFENLSLQVVRGVIHGRVSALKTEASEDELPLDEAFASLLCEWRVRAPEGIWVFTNPETGCPYHASPIQQDYIRAAGRRIGLAKDIGWHTFRHTYRSFLDESGAPIGVQQKLMRHAQIATTMNVYGNAAMTAKRTANSKVVEMVLQRPLQRAS